MKLSFSFLAGALLLPFSEASVALKDRWNIGTVEASSPGNFQYQDMSKAWLGEDPNLKVRATFYNDDCKVEGSGAGQGNDTPFYAAAGYTPSTASYPLVSQQGGESAFTDPSLSWDDADLQLKFATNPRVMTAMGDFGSDGVLVYCVRLGLYAGGTSIDEINFQESIVTLTITMDGTFTITDIGVAPKTQGTSDAEQSYSKVVASLCTAQTEGTRFNQGEAIAVCITLDDTAKTGQVEITSVDEFTWTRDGTSDQTAVGTPNEAGFGSDGLANNGLTMMTMTAAKDKATITSILFAKFYESEGTVTAHGSVTMAFPSAGAGASDRESPSVAPSSSPSSSPPLLQLNGASIDFAESSEATISATELTLTDNHYADIDASTLGNFGSSDFSIEFTLSSAGGRITPDGDDGCGYQGYLFMRAAKEGRVLYGPMATLDVDPDDGPNLYFGFGTNDQLECENALPNTPDSEAYSREVKFEKIGLNLTISINGESVCNHTMTKAIKESPLFVHETMRFGGHINHPNVKNLKAKLSKIKLVDDNSRRRRHLDGNNHRRLGSTNNNDNNRRRHLQDGGTAAAGFEISAELNKADDGPVALQQTAGAGTGAGTSISVVATIVGLVSAILLA